MKKNQHEMDDEIAALARYVDQPGQWEDVTPEEVKRERDKRFQAYIDEWNAKQETSDT